MGNSTTFLLAILLFMAALLYSAVGQAGASGYLAIMSIFSVAPEVMKPTALALNILVATITALKFYRANAFSWKILLPFALGSIPFAFIGGSLVLPSHLYKPVVGIILVYAAYRLFVANHLNDTIAIKPMPFWAGVICGIAIGFLSGLTGVGGGIFISPLLLFMGWAHTRETAGISAAFILLNSVAALLGNLVIISKLPEVIIYWAPAVVVGGFIGAEYGSKRLGNITLKRLLAIVLFIAGLKMMLT
jgi:uncharacterized membrane protein YfcA